MHADPGPRAFPAPRPPPRRRKISATAGGGGRARGLCREGHAGQCNLAQSTVLLVFMCVRNLGLVVLRVLLCV